MLLTQHRSPRGGQEPKSCLLPDWGTMDMKISVRALVEFILRSGDIDNRINSGADAEAMQAGSRAHKEIQKSQSENYRAEVPLKRTFTDGGLSLTLEGRADGIETTEEGVLIDEIKGVYADPDTFSEPYPLHLAQARCYAAIYAAREGLTEIACRITYCDISPAEEAEEDGIVPRRRRKKRKLRFFVSRYTAAELETWLCDLIGRYFVWAHFLEQHVTERDQSADELEFPYPYRAGQKETAVNVYRAVKRGRNLFIEAPTGVGKTLSTIYPAVKAVAEGLSGRIFYLTAKTVTRTVAQDTFRLLSERGLRYKTVTITAKEKACLNEVFECNPDACPYAKGHFDRVNEAVFDILQNEDIITRQKIEVYAEKHRVCPYEFSLDIASWCDAVIGDYNYAFDPQVKLKRFFSEGAEGEYILLIDEAHNLVSRASEMFSAVLKKEDILAVKKLTEGMRKKLTLSLTRCNREMLALRRAMPESAGTGRESWSDGQTAVLPEITALTAQLLTLDAELSKLLERRKSFPDRDRVLEFFFTVRNFVNVCGRLGDGYRIYEKSEPGKGFSVKLFCIDPSENLQETLALCRSAVFFSATLLPVSYYKELLTGNAEEYAVYAPSPFDPRNCLLAVGKDVSSRYTRRNSTEFARIAEYIRRTVGIRTGNYLCFFPSYEYLGKIEEQLRGGPYRLLIQSQHMTEEERETFLSSFDSFGTETQIGLCVMGGVFAEGIDLISEKLIGAVIVGTGLPMLNTELELARAFFDEHGKPGFDYAYRFPGMNKVMQAAGRVIRTAEDRGIVLLLDDRFLSGQYRALFPKEWADCRVTDLNGVTELVENFWHSL